MRRDDAVGELTHPDRCRARVVDLPGLKDRSRQAGARAYVERRDEVPGVLIDSP
jgi:hypothetical protein